MTTLLKGKELKKGMEFKLPSSTVGDWWEALGDFDHGQVMAKPRGSETSLSTIHKINIGSNAFLSVRDDTWDMK